MLNRAKEIEKEIFENRKNLHRIPEIGFELFETLEYVEKELRTYGIEPQRIGKSGLTFVLGKKKGKTILLRADMDALPMKEESGLDFASTNGNCHSCGHDIHTAMLLGAAKILKGIENELEGQVKFMFQPAEELLSGASDMIENGILENPKVDAAFALHVISGMEGVKNGHIQYKVGPLTLSGDAMKVEIIGKAAHGSTPYLGVDAISIAARIVLEINSMISISMPPYEKNIALVGKIAGGTSVNTVADRAVMEISLRSESNESRKKMIRRVGEIANSIASLYGAEAIVTHQYGMPPLINHKDVANKFIKYAEELLGAEKVQELERFSGAEDFSVIGDNVPAALFTLGVGEIEEGYKYSMHHPAVKFDENSFYIGTAMYAYVAKRWLEEI